MEKLFDIKPFLFSLLIRMSKNLGTRNKSNLNKNNGLTDRTSFRQIYYGTKRSLLVKEANPELTLLQDY